MSHMLHLMKSLCGVTKLSTGLSTKAAEEPKRVVNHTKTVRKDKPAGRAVDWKEAEPRLPADSGAQRQGGQLSARLPRREARSSSGFVTDFEETGKRFSETSSEGAALRGPCLPPRPPLRTGCARQALSASPSSPGPAAASAASRSRAQPPAKRLLRRTNGGLFGAAAKALIRITEWVSESPTL